jgi:hypothetical protein
MTSSAHTLETMIKKTHKNYLSRVAMYEAIGDKSSQRMMQMAFNKLDKLIKAYQDPATPKKTCTRCNEDRFATYDYVRRGGKRSQVCKPCELTSYTNLYAKTRRMGVIKNTPAALSSSKMSAMMKHALTKGALRDYNEATTQLRWRIKSLKSKMDGYTRMEMTGGYVRPQDQRSVANTVRKLSEQVALYEMLYKDQLEEIKQGKQPRDLATLYADWQRAHGS